MIGIAVCGAGNWGRNLVRNFAGLGEASLRCVCDARETVRRQMAAAYPQARITASLDDVLADDEVDAVVVAVESPRHAEVARAVLESGRHVYVEKPLALSVDDAAALAELAAAKNRKLMVGHLLRYHPAVDHMRRMIADGEIDPLYLYFQRVNLGVVRQEENAWWSLAPHDISIACDLFDATPASVSATGHAYLQPGVEDVVFANLKFADGRMAHIHVSWLDPHKMRKVTMVGTKKMVVFDDMAAGEKVRIYDKGADVRPDVADYAEAITLRTGDILIPAIKSAEPLAIECRHFIECIRDDKQPLSDGADGLRVVQVLAAGQASLEQGGAPVGIEGVMVG